MNYPAGLLALVVGQCNFLSMFVWQFSCFGKILGRLCFPVEALS